MADRIVDLPVLGMVRSTSFANNIARGVRRRQGVIEATVSVDTEEISILFDTDKATIRGLVDNLRQLGYDIAHKKIDIPVTGMNNKEDAHNVEKSILDRVEGVLEAKVNLSANLLSAEYMPRYSAVKDIVAAVEAAGYGAVVKEEDLKEGPKKEAEILPPKVEAPAAIPVKPVERPIAGETPPPAKPPIPKAETPPPKVVPPVPIPVKPVEKPIPAEAPPPAKPPVPKEEQVIVRNRIIDLPILGMTSIDCALIIENALKSVEGVSEVTVSFSAKEASILFNTEKTTMRAMVEKIRQVGYDVAAKTQAPTA